MKPYKRNFISDFGILVSKTGCERNVDWFFIIFISNITKLSEELYTISAEVEDNEVRYFISFDFSQDAFNELLNFTPEPIKAGIVKGLARQPFRVNLSTPFVVALEARLGELQTGWDEQFIPFVVTKVFPATIA